MATYIIIAIIAYAIGSINFSVLISKKMAGFDVREKGSGNAGTTNMLRSVGKKAAVIMMINWKIGLICLVFALVIMAFSRMVSMGSVGAAILFPVLTLFINTNFIVEASGMKYFIFSVILAAMVIFNHRANIKRIANGTENKLSFKNTNK